MRRLRTNSDPYYLDTMFGSGGLLSGCFPSYERRDGQINLARAVDAAIISGEHLLAEAPTGIGKSIAYAVPAIYHVAGINPIRERAVIATANIALQEQLVGKDLPMLSGVMPYPFTFALAKGRGNYLCNLRLDTFDPSAYAWDQGEALAIVEWARTTCSGDKSDLSFQPQPRLWNELSVTADACRGKKCKFFDDCFSNRAKEKVAQSDIVVANYHLLFADLSVRAATEGSTGVLPSYDVAVLDEGHRAADIARDFFGASVSEWGIKRLVTDANRVFREAGLQMDETTGRVFLDAEDAAVRWFGELLALKRSKSYQVRLRVPDEIDPTDMQAHLKRMADEFTWLGDRGRFDGAQRMNLRVLGVRAREYSAVLEQARKVSDEENVYFLEEITRGTKCAVSTKPIDVAPILRDLFFSKTVSVSVVSATLTVNGSFDHAAMDLGVDAVNELVVDTPFDLERQTLLVVPSGISPPNDPSFRAEVAETVVEVASLAGGRTLGLFTSYKNLELAYKALMDAAPPFVVMKQGDAPRMQLIADFKRDVNSVLLGTDSFWEGIDVPGEALSCVVIDRLPFITPDDPVVDVIASRDPRGWFFRWSLPRAVISFRQGFGRGVRTTTDRCVVVLLDRRVVDKSYGRTFLRSLGPVHITRALADVRVFLNEGTGS